MHILVSVSTVSVQTQCSTLFTTFCFVLESPSCVLQYRCVNSLIGSVLILVKLQTQPITMPRSFAITLLSCVPFFCIIAFFGNISQLLRTGQYRASHNANGLFCNNQERFVHFLAVAGRDVSGRRP